MKNIILIILCGLTVSCANLPFTKTDAFKQAFGDAIRSLEGQVLNNVPATIQDLRAKWLPQGDAYSQLASDAIRQYTAAHPTTNVEVQKVLEAIAMGFQTKT